MFKKNPATKLETSRGRSLCSEAWLVQTFPAKICSARPSSPQTFTPLLGRGKGKSHCYCPQGHDHLPREPSQPGVLDSSSWQECSLPPKPDPLQSAMGQSRGQWLAWPERYLAQPIPWMCLQESHCAPAAHITLLLYLSPQVSLVSS